LHDEHLTTGEVAAYLERSLTAPEQQRVERHLVHCSDCRREIVHVQNIESLSVKPRRRLYFGIAATVAAAALALIFVSPFDRSGPSPEGTTRGVGAEGTVSIVAVSPIGGSRVGPEEPMLLWRTVGDEPSYRITVTNESGDVVWSGRSSDTSLVVPMELNRGGTYYWYVDALLADGRPATTGIQQFVVAQ
jgi:hypothetical protein